MRGYDNYRGRTSPKYKIAVVVMLVILLLAGLYLAVSEFAEYDSEGNMHFILPWSGETEEPPAPPQDETETETREEPEKPSVNVVFDAPEDPLNGRVQATEFTVTQLRQGNDGILQRLGDGNVAAVWLKRPDGLLRYRSAAAGAGLCYTDGLTEAELRAFTSGDFYTVARLSCVKDNAASMKDMTALGLTQENGYIWYGTESQHYLDISKSGAADYLLSLIRELADLGFDEILLSDLTYPTDGRQDTVYTTNDRSGAVTDFLKKAKEALKETDTSLSVELTEETVLSGGNAAEGVELEAVLPLCARLYVKSDRAEELRAAVEKGKARPTLVFIGETQENRYTEAEK